MGSNIEMKTWTNLTKTDTKNEAKRLRATTFTITKLEAITKAITKWRAIEKSPILQYNILIEYQKSFNILEAPMICSPSVPLDNIRKIIYIFDLNLVSWMQLMIIKC